jgi:uncharacterized protein YbaR (Trm112 family)
MVGTKCPAPKVYRLPACPSDKGRLVARKSRGGNREGKVVGS